MDISETKDAKNKAKGGRRKIGEPISITLTPDQKEWVDSQIPAGGTRTSVIRRLVENAMKGD